MTDNNADNNAETNPQDSSMSSWHLKYLEEEAQRTSDAKTIVRKFVEDMKAAGATGTATLSFNGYGDSGDFESAEMTDEQKEIMQKLNYIFDYDRDKYVDGKWVNESKNLVFLLPHLAQLVPFDWVNNEGGYGEYTFNFDTAEVGLSSHLRVESTEDFDDTF